MCVPNPWLFRLVAVVWYLDGVGWGLVPMGACVFGGLAPACIDGSHEMRPGAGFFAPDLTPGVSVQNQMVVYVSWVTSLTSTVLTFAKG